MENVVDAKLAKSRALEILDKAKVNIESGNWLVVSYDIEEVSNETGRYGEYEDCYRNMNIHLKCWPNEAENN